MRQKDHETRSPAQSPVTAGANRYRAF